LDNCLSILITIMWVNVWGDSVVLYSTVIIQNSSIQARRYCGPPECFLGLLWSTQTQWRDDEQEQKPCCDHINCSTGSLWHTCHHNQSRRSKKWPTNRRNRSFKNDI